MKARAAVLVGVALAICRPNLGAELTLSVEGQALHSAMPFVLALTAKGFGEEPDPAPPPLAIRGCETTYLGVSPNVSSHIQIINGRRSEWRDVTFVFRWRVLCAIAGRYQVPALRVEQGGEAAASAPAAFEISDVPTSAEMVVRMRLPERPVWVGETFDVAVEWLLARDVSDYQFAVPLFNVPEARVQPPSNPPSGAAGTVRFAAGAADIELPLKRAETRRNGRAYTSFTFPARVTVNRAGPLELPPIGVVARLTTGATRDAFGFPRARRSLFRATGERRTLVVRPLPMANRPATFAGAIGSGFAIDVQASHTVVSVGDPIELTVRVRGDGPLEGIGLPSLSGPDALPPDQFSVPAGSLAGVIDKTDGGKRFTVVARVRSAEVREIPPIAFAYFDPAAGEYRTARSQPIALSVDAAKLVGVGDVVAKPPAASVPAAAGVGAGAPEETASAILIGAELSLSRPDETFARPWGSGAIGGYLAALYIAPLLVILASFYLVRSGGRRARLQTLRRAFADVQRALASDAPAREAAPLILAAMRRLANAAGAAPRGGTGALERLETQAFDPAAAGEAISAELRDELRAIAQGWSKKSAGRAAAPAAVLALAIVGLAPAAQAGPEPEAVNAARAAYQDALGETDRLRRVAGFAQAEQALRPVAAAHPRAAALQVDWGNAALGAQDVGRATLGYRRALRVAPGDERARANLAWLRQRLPAWLPRPASAAPLDSLLFWRGRLTSQQLLLVGAGAFAGGALLLAAWLRWRRKGLRAAAGALAVVWLAATATALAGGEAPAAIVLVDGAVLRSADSVGASPAFANPLPAGTEVRVLETRPSWLRVTLADGTRGWLAASTTEPVATRGASR